MSRHTIAVLFAVVISTLAGRAGASPVPLSTIPLAARGVPKATGTARVDGVRKVEDKSMPTNHLLVTALDGPVCVGVYEPTVADIEPLGSVWYSDGDSSGTEVEVFTLETDPEPVLDRLVIDRDSELLHAKVLRHARIPLAEIGGALKVYAFQTATRLNVLVPQGFDSVVDAFDLRMGSRQGCGFAFLSVPLTGGVASVSLAPPQPMKDSERWMSDSSEAFEILNKRFPNGRPETSSLWNVNASLSKVSRDPEPLVSVVLTAPPPPAVPSKQ